MLLFSLIPFAPNLISLQVSYFAMFAYICYIGRCIYLLSKSLPRYIFNLLTSSLPSSLYGLFALSMSTATYISISCHYDLIVWIDVNIRTLIWLFFLTCWHIFCMLSTGCAKFNFLICIFNFACWVFWYQGKVWWLCFQSLCFNSYGETVSGSIGILKRQFTWMVRAWDFHLEVSS